MLAGRTAQHPYISRISSLSPLWALLLCGSCSAPTSLSVSPKIYPVLTRLSRVSIGVLLQEENDPRSTTHRHTHDHRRRRNKKSPPPISTRRLPPPPPPTCMASTPSCFRFRRLTDAFADLGLPLRAIRTSFSRK